MSNAKIKDEAWARSQIKAFPFALAIIVAGDLFAIALLLWPQYWPFSFSTMAILTFGAFEEAARMRQARRILGSSDQ